MSGPVPVIIERSDVPPPRITRKGRKYGSGLYSGVILDLDIGQSVWNLTLNQLRAYKIAAWRNGVKLLIRLIPDTDLYMAKVIAKDKGVKRR